MRPVLLALAVAYCAAGLLGATAVSQTVAGYIARNGWDDFNRWTFPALAFLAGGLCGMALMRIRMRRPRAVEWLAMPAGGAFAAYTLDNALLLTTELIHLPQFAILTALFLAALPARPGAALGAALLAGVVDEWAQAFLPNRVLDINDVFLNWTGAWLGWLAWWSLSFTPERARHQGAAPPDTRIPGNGDG